MVGDTLPQADLDATRRFYDRISPAYDLISDASEHRAREAGLELLAVEPGWSVLEIGFGTGHGLEALARAVGPGGRVHGVDISEGMAEVARRRLEQEGLAGRATLQVAAVPPLPYGDGAFHAVSMSFTLELFPAAAIQVVLSEVRRVLRRDGRLGVVSLTAHPGRTEGALERAYRWMHRHFPHIVDCEPIPLIRVLEEAGFEVTARDERTLWTLPVTAAVARPS